MSAAPPPSPMPAPSAKLPPYRLTSDQFRAMLAAGLFEGSRVELIGGLLVEKMTKNPPHNVAVGELRDTLFRMVPGGWYVDEEKSIGIGPRDQPEPDVVVVRGRRRDYLGHHPSPAEIGLLVEVADSSYPRDQPEPDIVVVRGRRRDYLVRHPSPAEIGLLVEVADSSYPRDRGPKWRRYASAGIGIYWIVNLAARRIEAYSDPDGRGRSASYRTCIVHREDGAIPVVLDDADVGRFTVKDILP